MADQAGSQSTTSPLSDIAHFPDKETLDHITPYAFRVKETLLGLPLARPWRRAVALKIDLVLVSLLSLQSTKTVAVLGVILFGVLAYRTKQSPLANKLTRRYSILTVLCLVFAISLFTDQFADKDAPPVELELSGVNIGNEPARLSLAKMSSLIALMSEISKLKVAEQCDNVDCYQTAMESFAIKLAGLRLPQETVDDAFSDIAEESRLTAEEKVQFLNFLQQRYRTAASALVANEMTAPANDSSTVESQPAKVAVIPAALSLPENSAPVNKSDAGVSRSLADSGYSVIEWIKGIIQDLGLGFGWAAFYFTVMLSRNGGQTLGKQLLRIRVIKLDAKPLSLWESFGRYGGYGAGLATGLLGFLQIFWDPNRQAIHDKIAGTVVIQGNLPTELSV